MNKLKNSNKNYNQDIVSEMQVQHFASQVIRMFRFFFLFLLENKKEKWFLRQTGKLMVWDTDKTHTMTGEERMFKQTKSGTVSIPVFLCACFNRLSWSLQNVNMLMRWTDETQEEEGERVQKVWKDCKMLLFAWVVLHLHFVLLLSFSPLGLSSDLLLIQKSLF